jgi:hypothetical protein
VSINGANRLGSNSLTELLVFGRRAALSAIEYVQSGARAAVRDALADAAQARLRELMQRTGGAETVAGVRREMMQTMEEHAGIYRTGRRTCRGLREARRAARALPEDRAARQEQRLQHRPAAGARTRLDARVRRGRGAERGWRARSRAARTSGSTIPSATTGLSPKHSLAAYRGRAPAHRLPRRGDHEIAARRARLLRRPRNERARGSSWRCCATTRSADAEPRFQRYAVPCREEWVVLDALNHVKENLDPTLSYRWSCHMAVCGSCGMMINGEPKLACKAFLRDYPTA